MGWTHDEERGRGKLADQKIYEKNRWMPSLSSFHPGSPVRLPSETCRGCKSHMTLLSFISRGEREFGRVKIRTGIMQYFAPCRWPSRSSSSWIQFPFSRTGSLDFTEETRDVAVWQGLDYAGKRRRFHRHLGNIRRENSWLKILGIMTHSRELLISWDSSSMKFNKLILGIIWRVIYTTDGNYETQNNKLLLNKIVNKNVLAFKRLLI